MLQGERETQSFAFHHLFFFPNDFIYFWLFWVFVVAWVFLKLRRAGATLVEVRGLLITTASLVGDETTEVCHLPVLQARSLESRSQQGKFLQRGVCSRRLLALCDDQSSLVLFGL